MASNYQQFEEDNDFGVSASNLSFVEFVEDEQPNSNEAGITSEVSIKDRNNNGNNQFINDVEQRMNSRSSTQQLNPARSYDKQKDAEQNFHKSKQGVSNQSIPNVLRWEQEGESLVNFDINNEPRSEIKSLDCSNLDLQLSSSSMSSKLQHESNVLIPPLVEEENMYADEDCFSDASSRFAEESSSCNEESDTGTVVRSLKMRSCRSSQSDASIKNSHNQNENNNKKKKLLPQTSNSDEKTSETSSNRRERATPKNTKQRFRSVQLSSMRALPANIRNKPGSWLMKNVEYGQRLVEKNGASNVQIVVNMLSKISSFALKI